MTQVSLAGRLAGLATAGAIALTLAPVTHAAAATGSATLTGESGGTSFAWEAPGTVQLNSRAALTFRVDGNSNAGRPASYTVKRLLNPTADPALAEWVTVASKTFRLTSGEQIFKVPLSTSRLYRGAYSIDYDGYDDQREGMTFGFWVMNESELPAWVHSELYKISVARTPARVKVGTRLKVTGVASGQKLGGRVVVVQARTPRGWVKVAQTRVKVNTGVYTVRTAALSAKMRQLRVTMPDLKGSSAARNIKVVAERR